MKKHYLLSILAALVATQVDARPTKRVEQPRVLDLNSPADAFEVYKKVQCGAGDNVPAVYHWSGNAYSYVDGERQKLLFGLEGMNVRQCISVIDEKRGKGFRMVSREIMLFTDPKSGQIMRNWQNPWTGETVEVMQVNNDPVNMAASYPFGADGKPFQIKMQRAGNVIFIPIEVPLFYTNVLGGAFQDYVGGKYQAMEIFDFSLDANDALNSANTTTYPAISWVRLSDWMPWMKMSGRQGKLVFNAVGVKLSNYDDLPAILKNEIELNYPIYKAPPPIDDIRSNETTWTVFKAKIEKARESGHSAQPKGH